MNVITVMFRGSHCDNPRYSGFSGEYVDDQYTKYYKQINIH